MKQAPPEIGLAETGREQVSERVLALTLDSKAMGREMDARVLLPQGYDPARATRSSTCSTGRFGQEGDWLELGDAERIVGDRELIVVMADGGLAELVLRLVRHRRRPGGRAAELGELPRGRAGPVRGRHLPARSPIRSNRFIAGLSSGGHGAFKYAAQNPGLFGAAGEFSGAVDTTIELPGLPGRQPGASG